MFRGEHEVSLALETVARGCVAFVGGDEVVGEGVLVYRVVFLGFLEGINFLEDGEIVGAAVDGAAVTLVVVLLLVVMDPILAPRPE